MSTIPFEKIPVEQRKIAVSGGFDPLHIGHIRMMEKAAEFGPLYVILNSDKFLLNKKGRVFMPFEERKEIIKALRCVHQVVDCIDDDQTVCRTLEELRPDAFLNGGDRVWYVPETEICRKLGIAMIFGIGGGKINSSSKLCEDYENAKNRMGMVVETGELPIHVAEDSTSQGSDKLSISPEEE